MAPKKEVLTVAEQIGHKELPVRQVAMSRITLAQAAVHIPTAIQLSAVELGTCQRATTATHLWRLLLMEL